MAASKGDLPFFFEKGKEAKKNRFSEMIHFIHLSASGRRHCKGIKALWQGQGAALSVTPVETSVQNACFPCGNSKQQADLIAALQDEMLVACECRVANCLLRSQTTFIVI